MVTSFAVQGFAVTGQVTSSQAVMSCTQTEHIHRHTDRMTEAGDDANQPTKDEHCVQDRLQHMVTQFDEICRRVLLQARDRYCR
jgi:hypothetical protein